MWCVLTDTHPLPLDEFKNIQGWRQGTIPCLPGTPKTEYEFTDKNPDELLDGAIGISVIYEYKN